MYTHVIIYIHTHTIKLLTLIADPLIGVKKSVKIVKFLPRMMTKTEISNIRNEKGDTAINPADVTRIF